MGKKITVGYRRRRLLRVSLLKVLTLQLAAFALAGGALYVIAELDLVKDFYSAHRSLESMRKLILPGLLLSSGLGFLLVSIFTWLGFRSYTRKLVGPIQRVEEMLQRLSRGDLTYTPAVVPDRQRWSLDDSADEMLEAYRKRLTEVQRLSKEVHNKILSLRYKTTGGEPLTLTELRGVTAILDTLCKQLNTSIKWFET